MTDDKSGEDKLFEGDNAQEEKVSPEDSTGAPAVIKPVQAEIIPDVPIAKSAAPAATAAATASAVDARAAQKAQDKARRAAQKAQKKAEKLKARREKQQALIDSCPPQYKPVSTSGFFWLGFISYLPCVGLVITILLSLLPRNKNIKHFERAILIMYLIAVIIALVLGIVFFFSVPADNRQAIASAIEKICMAFGF